MFFIMRTWHKTLAYNDIPPHQRRAVQLLMPCARNRWYRRELLLVLVLVLLLLAPRTLSLFSICLVTCFFLVVILFFFCLRYN